MSEWDLGNLTLLGMLLTFRCADGNWINIGYYKTLLGMGYTEVE